MPLDAESVEFCRSVLGGGKESPADAPDSDIHTRSECDSDSGSSSTDVQYYDWDYRDSFVKKILEATRHMQETDPFAASLYSMAWSHALQMRLPCAVVERAKLPTAQIPDDDFFKILAFDIARDNTQGVLAAYRDPRFSNLSSHHIGVEEGRKDTPLHLAARYYASKTIDALLQCGFDADALNAQGQTALHLCVAHDRDDMVHQLLSKGASTLPRDCKGMTVWHCAASNNATRCLQTLVKSSGQHSTQLRELCNAGDTPLAVAIQHGSEDAALYLLPLCKNDLSFTESHTSLYTGALRMGSAQIVEALFDAGISPDKELDKAQTFRNCLSNKTSVGCIEAMQRIYPDFHAKMLDGETVLEAFAKAMSFTRTTPQSLALFRSLLGGVGTERQPGVMWRSWLNVEENAVVWFRKQHNETRSWSRPRLTESSVGLIRLFVEKGFVRNFEQNEGSAFVAFANACSAAFAHDVTHLKTELRLRPGLWSTIDKMADYLLHTASDAMICFSAQDQSVVDLFGLLLCEEYYDSNVIKTLLEKGFDTRLKTTFAPGNRGPSALEVACSPSFNAPIRVLEQLLKYTNERSLNDFQAQSDQDLLALLCMGGDKNGERVPDLRAKVLLLLQHGANPNIRSKDKKKCSALMYAIKARLADIAQILLDAGADPNLKVDLPDVVTGLDAALLCAYCGCDEILQHLLLGHTEGRWTVDWNATGEHTGRIGAKITGLMLAASRGHLAVVKFYVENGLLNDLDKTDEDPLPYTPMHWAAERNDVPMMEYLYQKGASIGAAGKNLPLHCAATAGSEEATEKLLEWGSAHTGDHYGDTPMDLASSRGHEAVVRRIKAYLENAETALKSEDDALDYRLRLLDNSIIARDYEECVRVVGLGCPLNRLLPPECKYSPLALAVLMGNFELAKLFLVNGASTLDSVSYHDHTAYMFAGGRLLQSLFGAGAKHREANELLPDLLTRYLEETGYMVPVSSFLTTVLHSAVASGNVDGVSILLAHICENRAAYT